MIEWSQTLINLANANLRLNIKDQKITDYIPFKYSIQELKYFYPICVAITIFSPVCVRSVGQRLANTKELERTRQACRDIKGVVCHLWVYNRRFRVVRSSKRVKHRSQFQANRVAIQIEDSLGFWFTGIIWLGLVCVEVILELKY